MNTRLRRFLSQIRRLLRRFGWITLFLVLGLGFGIGVIVLSGLPSLDRIGELPNHRTSIIYDRTGTHELYRLYAEENRIVLYHDAIPDVVRHATIAAEDRHFFTHSGIEISSLFRALLKNIEAQDIQQGGSTITQQLARALYLTRERTLSRKAKEILLALRIEHRLSKDEILDLYLNTVPYGANAYGIETASQIYFGKSSSHLRTEEAVLLAVLPSAPSTYSPYGGNTHELLLRARRILITMHDLGFISTEEFKRASTVNPLEALKPRQEPIVAPHFVFFVLNELQKTYSEDTLRTGGLRIRTSLNLSLQSAAEQAVVEGAKRNAVRKASNAALVATDPQNGEIVAMVGSKDYFNTAIDGNVNVTTSSRQPGSTFKPFTYATAFSKGYEPETKIYDVPIDFGPDGTDINYIPQNYDGKFHGLLTMRETLGMSLNVPAVQTLALAGIKDTVNTATRLGITTLADAKNYGLALTLGGAEVRPLDMARAFGAFGQEGVTHPMVSVLTITDHSGKTLFQTPHSPGEQVLEREVARKINSILSDNQARAPIFGARSPLAFPAGIAIAAKTGTTQDFNDAWTVGYTPSLSVAVWVGNNDHSPMTAGSDGIFVAAPIWRDFMEKSQAIRPGATFAPYQPSSTVSPFPVRPPGLTLKDIEPIFTYLDVKTGRELSPEQVKKMKKKRYQVIKSDPFGAPLPS